MAEIKKEEAKKELGDMVDKAKAGVKKAEEAGMSDADKAKAVEDKKKADALEKRNTEILNASEEDIKDPKKFTDDERSHRTELIEKKRIEDEAKLSNDDKIKHIKEESQKAIDRISNELKQIQDKSSKEAEALRKELEILKKEKAEPSKEDLASVIAKEEQDRIAKYTEEDKGKPREERREMSEEELDNWLVEEPSTAQRWIVQNVARRNTERRNAVQNKKLKVLFDKHHESALRTYAKHPELDTTKREDELITEKKSKEEVAEILLKENEKYRIVSEILMEHPDWIAYEDCPERIVAEMEKRLASGGVSGNETFEDLTTKIEELSAEVARLTAGDEGIGGGNPPKRNKTEMSEAEKIFLDAARESKLPQASIDSAIKKFKARKGNSAAI